MKIIKVDGTNKSYIMENGDVVPFDEIKAYVTKGKLFGEETFIPKKRKTRKKKL